MRHVYRFSSQLSETQMKMMQKGLPKKKDIEGVKKIILVSSAKGGVGKSTIAANLAISLADVTPNRSVGILDVDVFGPSIPTLFNVANIKAEVNKYGMMLPLNNYGVKIMSIGSIIDEDAALVWRGLMVMSAVERLLYNVKWSGIDCLVVDLPPGTGDVQLSVCQRLNIDGAIIVTTPQELSIADVRRGLKMFQLMKIPVLGLVKNMSFFMCSCGEKHRLFGDSDLTNVLGEKVDPLCELPIDGGGSSDPIVVTNRDATSSLIYRKLAETVWSKINASTIENTNI